MILSELLSFATSLVMRGCTRCTRKDWLGHGKFCSPYLNRIKSRWELDIYHNYSRGLYFCVNSREHIDTKIKSSLIISNAQIIEEDVKIAKIKSREYIKFDDLTKVRSCEEQVFYSIIQIENLIMKENFTNLIELRKWIILVFLVLNPHNWKRY